MDLRTSLKKGSGHAPGLLAFIALFVTAGLKKYPELNTRIETAADGSLEIVPSTVSPWIRGPDGPRTNCSFHQPCRKLSVGQLDTESRRLTDVAREGKATPTELGAVNNYGVFGVDGSAAISRSGDTWRWPDR